VQLDHLLKGNREQYLLIGVTFQNQSIIVSVALHIVLSRASEPPLLTVNLSSGLAGDLFGQHSPEFSLFWEVDYELRSRFTVVNHSCVARQPVCSGEELQW
jgi:hypothetical protein